MYSFCKNGSVDRLIAVSLIILSMAFISGCNSSSDDAPAPRSDSQPQNGNNGRRDIGGEGQSPASFPVCQNSSGEQSLGFSSDLIPFFTDYEQERFKRGVKRISADGKKMLVIERAVKVDTSLSGWLKKRDRSVGNHEAAKVYIMDMATKRMKLIYTGNAAVRSVSGGGYQLANFDHNFYGDIDGDGSHVALSFLRGQINSDNSKLTTMSKYITVDTRTLSVVDQAAGESESLGGNTPNPIKISDDGNHLLFFYADTGEEQSTWGVTYRSAGKYRIYYANAAKSEKGIYFVSDDPSDDINEVYPSYSSFDISRDGSKIIFQYYADGRVITVKSGSEKVLYRSGVKQQSHVAISADGSQVAYAEWNESSSDRSAIDRVMINNFAGGNERVIIDQDYFHPGNFFLNHNGSALVFQTFNAKLFGYSYETSPSYFMSTNPASIKPLRLNVEVQSASGNLATVITQASVDRRVLVNKVRCK
jgi:hypothetical protein